jgi:rhodanese-related sulfurtransferase
MRKKAILISSIGMLIASCSALPVSGASDSTSGYQMISVADLRDLMDSEEFTLVNVHIPHEGNIPGTDAAIPFDEIEHHLDLLPAEKDAKIVLYCRSGSMSRTASQKLVELGYTNVFDLEGGYNAWVANKLPFEE